MSDRELIYTKLEISETICFVEVHFLFSVSLKMPPNFLKEFNVEEFSSSTLPSRITVLKGILFNRFSEKRSVEESISITVKRVMEVWSSFGFEIVHRTNVMRMATKLFVTWKSLSKNYSKNSVYYQNKRNRFRKQKNMFDIRKDKTNKTAISTFKRKLLKRPLPTREHSIVASSSSKQVSQKTTFVEYFSERESTSQSSINSESSSYKGIDMESDGKLSVPLEINSQIAGSLDRNFITAGQATNLCAAITNSLGIQGVHLSKRTIERRLVKARSEAVTSKREILQNGPECLEIHFDGKNFPNKKVKEDYIAVVGSFGGFSEILRSRTVKDGSAKTLSKYISDTIIDYDLTSRIVAFSFDTTNVNAGNWPNIILFVIS